MPITPNYIRCVGRRITVQHSPRQKHKFLSEKPEVRRAEGVHWDLCEKGKGK
jgi:hypothetical protein